MQKWGGGGVSEVRIQHVLQDNSRRVVFLFWDRPSGLELAGNYDLGLSRVGGLATPELEMFSRWNWNFDSRLSRFGNSYSR